MSRHHRVFARPNEHRVLVATSYRFVLCWTSPAVRVSLVSKTCFVLAMYSQLRSYQGAIIDFRTDPVVGDDAKNITNNPLGAKAASLDALASEVHLAPPPHHIKRQSPPRASHDPLRPHKLVDTYPSGQMQVPTQFWQKPPRQELGPYPHPPTMDTSDKMYDAGSTGARPKEKHVHLIHPQLIETPPAQFGDAVGLNGSALMMHADKTQKLDPLSRAPHRAPLLSEGASESPSITVAMVTPPPISPTPRDHGPRKPAGEVKRKRGRPKKIILDPSTNTYIDSSHPNFKQLNKQLKPMAHQYRLDDGTTQLASAPSAVLRSYDQNEVRLLLQKKDKRGRPRKFPVEETGLTIKGVRINGAKRRKHLDMPPPP